MSNIKQLSPSQLREVRRLNERIADVKVELSLTIEGRKQQQLRAKLYGMELMLDRELND